MLSPLECNLFSPTNVGLVEIKIIAPDCQGWQAMASGMASTWQAANTNGRAEPWGI